MGATFADHLINHALVHAPRAHLLFWTFATVTMFALGLIPTFDNITHGTCHMPSLFARCRFALLPRMWLISTYVQSPDSSPAHLRPWWRCRT